MRWISGIIMAIVATLLLLYAPQEAVQGVVVLLSMIGAWEFFSMTLKKEARARQWIGILLCGIVVAALIFWVQTAEEVMALIVLIVFVTFLSHFRGHGDLKVRVSQMMFFLFGLAYMASTFTYWGWIRALENWHFWVFLMLTCTFLSDTGAYLAGKAFGKHKLAPSLSPKKTVEGFIGGWVAAVAGSFVVRLIFQPEYPIGLLVAISSLVAFVGPLGDLSESLIKRGVDVKDSSQLIPGHGGVLDRVDALLFTAPVVYYFAKYFPG